MLRRDAELGQERQTQSERNESALPREADVRADIP